MNNYKQPGDVLTLAAPAGGVVAGTGYKIGQLFVVAENTVAATLPFPARIVGVVELPKLSAQAWTEGELVYWDDGQDECTTVAAGNLLIGAASAVADNPSSVGLVRLNGAARHDGISDDELEDESVDTAAIQDLAVTTAKLDADAVDGTKIEDNAVDSEHIAAGAVDREHLEAALVSAAAGDAIFDHTDDAGVNELIAAQAGIDRTVLVIAKVTQTLAGGVEPVFDVGYPTVDDAIIDGLAAGTAGDVFMGVGTLPAGEALNVTVTDGTGGGEAGKLQVAAIVVPT
jgi:predicted RecA/RadA family phage recombinase